MDRNELELLVRTAVDLLFARDAALLVNNSSEWSVAHRLAVYLEALLPGWNVDCEFNRQGEEGQSKFAADGNLVRPDIVVHHRGRGEVRHNLLIIELKKGDASSDYDKVQEYTRPPTGKRQFQYRHGLAISLAPDCTMTWFSDGKVAT